MIARFTGKNIPSEARPATCSLNLILKIRQRRLRWVGHILRKGPGHITYTALAVQSTRNLEGNLLMDAPPPTHLSELTHLAMDRAAWSSMVRHIPVQIPTKNQQNCAFRRSIRSCLTTMKSVSLWNSNHNHTCNRSWRRSRLSRILFIYYSIYLWKLTLD